MKRYYRVFAIVIGAAMSPVSATAQPPSTAGASRPGLRVLQALPEAQLFPLMNVLSDSLGVRCDYCHVQEKPDFSRTPSNVGGWLWASDEKPQKTIAREMMRMVVDLNAGRFNGAARITCFTCHRGARQPARLPLLPPPAGDSGRTRATPPLPSADRVWNNYSSAVGPIGSSAPNTSAILSGWDDRPEGRYGKVEIIIAGVDRYRATVTTPTATTAQGFDAESAWVLASERVQQLTAADSARMRRIAMRYWPLKSRPANLRVIGVERIGDRDAYVATSKIDPITTATMYFDVVSGLLRREMTVTETLLLPLQEQVDYDDYRDVNGVQWPFEVRTSEGGAPFGTVTRTFLQIRRNVAVDDALFGIPPKPQ